MIGWLSKSNRDQKKKDVQEKNLKQSLADKISQYEDHTNNQSDDHTEVFLGGKKIRVAKEQIDIGDVASTPPSKPK
jgi:hypothetical protein